MMLDEFAESLGRNVDTGKQLAARCLPAGAAAFQDRDIGIAESGELGGGALGQALAAAVQQHQGHAMAGHQVADHQLQPGERQRTGEEWMPLVMHALLAHVEQRELGVREQQLAQRRGRNGANHARPGRASRMSECGGNIPQACSSGL